MGRLYDAKLHGLHQLMKAEIRSVRQEVSKVETTNISAVEKVERVNTQKFEAQNEWRAQFKDQMVTFLSRKEFWAVILTVLVALILNYLKK